MDLHVSTIAGCGKEGHKEGKAQEAMFKNPCDLCISQDSELYISDHHNNRIRMVSDGIVSTIAGCGERGFLDGKSEEAMFNGPHGICTSLDGSIYVVDCNNHCIRKISDGVVSTIAGCREKGFKDGKAEEAMFCYPGAICMSDQSVFYVIDGGNNRIRMLSDGIVSTFAGTGQNGYRDGKVENAMFDCPSGICLSKDGKIYLADPEKRRIRMISGGIVYTIAGTGKSGYIDGEVKKARFKKPGGVCIAHDGKIYVSDNYDHRIRMISDGRVSTIAGNGQKGFKDGKAQDATFCYLSGLCVSDDGKMYITDTGNHSIRMISGLPISSTHYFELGSLLNSKSLSDMTLTINNHQYHLHTAVIQSLCPLIIKHISIIEDAKISNESLQTMFEMIYSNNTIKIRKQPDQYQSTDLIHLIELIWLFESFEINNRSFVTICIKQLKMRLKHLMKQDEYNPSLETLKNDLIHRIDELVALSQLHGLQTTKLVEINNFSNQNNKQNENQQGEFRNTDNNHGTVTFSMSGMFMLLGLHTEPRVVDQQQESQKLVHTPNTELKTQPDYTIKTHDRSYSIKCHKVILYAKWPYFRRMIESGFLESASGEMIMSEDWNETRMYDFVKYLYTYEVGFESKDDAEWLFDNADMYELIEVSTNNNNEPASKIPKRDYQLLITTCEERKKKVIYNYDLSLISIDLNL